MVADEERRMISARTKAALAAAKKRGQKLGGYRGAKITPAIRKAARAAVKARTDERAADLAPVINELRAAGITTLGGLAHALTERRIPTARGGLEWSAVQVSRVLSRLEPSRPFVDEGASAAA
jgi:DNA invertase Pin-like site-specific DNA recombinase